MQSDEKLSVFRNIAMITQVSLYVMVPVFLCLGVGIWLEGRFGLPLTLPMLILGLVTGGRTGYVTVKAMIDADEARRRKRLKDEIERKVAKSGKIKKP